MLFNSNEFLFFFLPVTLIGFYVLGRYSRSGALNWLILASLFFYAWWRPFNVLIIAPSIAINFTLARILARLNENDETPRLSKTILLLGVAFNIAFLGFFKYVDFVSTSINDVFGSNLVMLNIILPLGISFITFQKIAFLIDVQSGRIRSFTLKDYCIFVLFFPQLVAGPIVHYREMIPQFRANPCRFNKEDFAVGITLLIFGLFKKVVIADHVATIVSPIYERSAGGEGTSLIVAWIAAVGFTLQLYFDFSGYSDMALGLARFFGIKLPQNFDAPLRASSIIDFWLRWHMTLTRFLTGYIYNPMALWLTRRRLAKGLPAFGGRNTTIGSFVYLLMFPTLVTMLISGLWHGAGYGFIIWGFLHGCFLTVNHAWRLVASKLWSNKRAYDRIMTPVGFVLTFLVVCIAIVFFRATTIAAASDLLRGLAGLNGVGLPKGIFGQLGGLGNTLQSAGAFALSWSVHDFIKALLWVAVPLFIALACPDTFEILAPYEPALGVTEQSVKYKLALAMKWNTSIPWAVAMSAMAAITIVSIGGPSEFLYWQF
jgi:D-alanyl-lipoteichoic acid acyltransferase DltB (MBOAT superfamily)